MSPAGRLAWPLLCLLSAAAHAAAGPAPRCIGPQVAGLDLLQAGDLSAVPVALNGRPASLVVDTGATHVALSAAAAAVALGLPGTLLAEGVASGIGGAISPELVDLRELDVGGIRFPARNIPVKRAADAAGRGRPACRGRAGRLGPLALRRRAG